MVDIRFNIIAAIFMCMHTKFAAVKTTKKS